MLVINILRSICSQLSKRGLEVKEFNLPPPLKEKYKPEYFRYNDKPIPVTSHGWVFEGKRWYREFYTSEGIIRVQDIVYTL